MNSGQSAGMKPYDGKRLTIYLSFIGNFLSIGSRYALTRRPESYPEDEDLRGQ